MSAEKNKEKLSTEQPEQSKEQPLPDRAEGEEKKEGSLDKKESPVKKRKEVSQHEFEDLVAEAERRRELANLNFDAIYNAARKQAKEYEELALMLKRIFGINPYIPEENRMIKTLYRLGAPEIAEAYRECLRAAEVDRKGAVTPDYCESLKWDRFKQAVERINKEIDQLYSRSSINDIMLFGLNGVSESISIISKELEKGVKTVIAVAPSFKKNDKIKSLSHIEGAGLLKASMNKVFDGVEELARLSQIYQKEDPELAYKLKFYANMGTSAAANVSKTLMAGVSYAVTAGPAEAVRKGKELFVEVGYLDLPLWARKDVMKNAYIFAKEIAERRGDTVREIIEEISKAEQEGKLEDWLKENFRLSFHVTPDLLLRDRPELDVEKGFEEAVIEGNGIKDVFYGSLSVMAGGEEAQKDENALKAYVKYGTPLLSASLERGKTEVNEQGERVTRVSLDEERFSLARDYLSERLGKAEKKVFEKVADKIYDFLKDGREIKLDDLEKNEELINKILREIQNKPSIPDKERAAEEANYMLSVLDELRRKALSFEKSREEAAKVLDDIEEIKNLSTEKEPVNCNGAQTAFTSLKEVEEKKMKGTEKAIAGTLAEKAAEKAEQKKSSGLFDKILSLVKKSETSSNAEPQSAGAVLESPEAVGAKPAEAEPAEGLSLFDYFEKVLETKGEPSVLKDKKLKRLKL